MWTAALSVATAAGDVPIRATTPRVAELLAEGLEDFRGADCSSFVQGFGLRVADEQTRFNWLYWGGCPIVRSRDGERILAALERHLSRPGVPTDGRVLLEAPVAIKPGVGAVILPPTAAEKLRALDRRFRDSGVIVYDGPVTILDPGSAEIELPTVPIRIDPARRAMLDDLITTKREERQLPHGPFRAIRWLLDEPIPATASGRLARVLPSTRSLEGARDAVRIHEMMGDLAEELGNDARAKALHERVTGLLGAPREAD